MFFSARWYELPQVTKKVLVVGCIYILYLLTGVFRSFSVQTEEPKEHFFVSNLPRWVIPNVPEKWGFVIFVGCMAVLIFFIIIISNSRKVKEDGLVALIKLSILQYIFLDFIFVLFAYASTYDIAYYGFENICLPYTRFVCVNIANSANFFAWGSAIVYLLRITTKLVPGEDAWIEFCGFQMQALDGGSVYVLPGLPYPYFLYALSISLFENDLGLWSIYHKPDGRSRATMLVHR
jgi:hypothetical protein